MQAPTVPTVPTVSFGPANTSAAARPAVQIRLPARAESIAAVTALVYRAYRRDPLGLP